MISSLKYRYVLVCFEACMFRSFLQMRAYFLPSFFVQVELKAMFGMCYSRGIEGQNLISYKVNSK